MLLSSMMHQGARTNTNGFLLKPPLTRILSTINKWVLKVNLAPVGVISGCRRAESPCHNGFDTSTSINSLKNNNNKVSTAMLAAL